MHEAFIRRVYIFIYIKLFALLYTDDTVIMSHSGEDLQNALYAYDDYCKRWKMHAMTQRKF